MKTAFKRILSLLMVLVMLGAMLPAVYADNMPEPEDDVVVLTDEDYAIVNDVFARIDAMEDAPAKKSATRTQVTDAAAQIVMASENYVEGSLERNGNSFTWWTDEGIRCIYNPYMREKYDNMQAPAEPEPDGIYNAPKATKGGWPSGNQVYLIAPYYGIDDTFTDQYKNEAKAIASAIGDTDGYTLCSGTSVTVDTVADAIENGAVVIFDSHGTTDYDGSYVCDDPDGYEVYDYVSKANYSYLCLTNKSGLTTQDYQDGATYFTDSNGEMCACINGAAIANHMEKNSPGGLLWMAICLGMATDTICEPMRAKGVEVVYGYSQSVTFAGDYCFEATFWDNMIDGKTVAQSITAMKSKWGKWDWSEEIASYYGYTGTGYTLTEARQYRSAFPIVVSDEDAHPGQRDSGTNYGACSEQTVKSTYTLYNPYTVTAQSNNTAWGTVSVSGSTITATPKTGYFTQSATVLSGTATVTQNGNTFSVVAESNCVVQINFAAKTVVTVNFSGANVNGKTGYAGDAMTLPTAEAPEGYQFLGWMTAPLSSDTTVKPSSFYTTSFTPNGNTTLYALYSYVDENSGSGTGDYVKVTATPSDWTGEYILVYESGSLILDSSLSTLDAKNNYENVTISNDTISAAEGDPYKLTIAEMSGGYSIKAANGKYISGSSGSNKLNTGTSPVANTLSVDANGNTDIVSNTSHLRYNTSDNRFRYYKAASYSSQQAVALYVKDGTAGTTYYTSNPVKCEHTNTAEIPAVPATCTVAGYTAGVECTDCGSIISGHEVVAALGHSYGNWTQSAAPTCTTAGTQSHTCITCGTVETQTVAATGHSFNSGVVTEPAGCETSGIKTYTCLSCGATTTEAIPATDHSYVNGVCTGCGKAEPTVPKALQDGDQVVIFAPAYGKALSTQPSPSNTYYNKGVNVAVEDGVVTGYGSTEIWTVIANSDGTYSFAYNGQNLAMGTKYSSMTLGEIYDDWYIIDLGDGLYNVQNADRGNYIEWYASKNNFSTYYDAKDDQFQLSFYVIGKGILNSDAEEPEQVTNEVIAYGMYLGSDLNMVFNLHLNENSQVIVTVGEQSYSYYANQLSLCEDGSYDVYIPLAAAQMADEIVVKFVTNGVEGDSEIYTVKEYADYILTDVNNDFTDEDKALVQAMLNYGGAAQAYFGHNTENLVSTQFGTEEIPTAEIDDMLVEDTSGDISFYGASLIYRDRLAVRFYFTGNVEGKLFTVQGKEVEAMQNGDLYYVEIGDIMPYELDKQYTVTADGLSVTYGPMNYIARMSQKEDAALQNLMKALYNYYWACWEYLPSE